MHHVGAVAVPFWSGSGLGDPIAYPALVALCSVNLVFMVIMARAHVVYLLWLPVLGASLSLVLQTALLQI